MIAVEMDLSHVLYVSFLVPALRLRPAVPSNLPLAKVVDDSVFVSVVTLLSTGVKVNLFPWPKFNYCQLNIRTYVIDPKGKGIGVYFFRSALTSSVTARLTRLIGLPWEPADLTLRSEDPGPQASARYELTGRWHGEIDIEASPGAVLERAVPPFLEADDMVSYLVNPGVGCYGREGKTRRFEVAHRSVQPSEARVALFRLPFLTELGLVEEREMQQPHNALFVPEAHFRIHMPPRRLGDGG
jgi:uncharacterized protein YqjF (DUF2071 family)